MDYGIPNRTEENEQPVSQGQEQVVFRYLFADKSIVERANNADD